MKKRTKQIFLNLNDNFYPKNEFRNDLMNSSSKIKNIDSENKKSINHFPKSIILEDEKNKKNNFNNGKVDSSYYSKLNINNKENNVNNGNFNFDSNQTKPYYLKLNINKLKKQYNNCIPNAHSYFSTKINNKENIFNRPVKENIYLRTKNHSKNYPVKKGNNNKNIINKINFNDDLIMSKYFSTNNIFKRNEIKDINNHLDQLYISETTKNKKPKIERKNNYSNGLNINRTYSNINKGILKTNFYNDMDNKKNIHKKAKIKNKEIKTDFNVKLNTTKNYIKEENRICFNKEKNKSFSSGIIKEFNKGKKNENVKSIKKRHRNNKIKANNPKRKKLKNLIFNFERLEEKEFV